MKKEELPGPKRTPEVGTPEAHIRPAPLRKSRIRPSGEGPIEEETDTIQLSIAVSGLVGGGGPNGNPKL